MPIPLIHENYINTGFPITYEMANMEVCFFCQTPTRCWHTRSNVSVCPDCGKTHSVDELPKIKTPLPGKNPSPVNHEALVLLQQSDTLYLEIEVLRKQLRTLNNKQIDLHRVMRSRRIIVTKA